jgi:histidinol-phosphate phosphatase family protein
VPLPGVRRALDRLRDAGLRVGVISNQSGLARGLITPGDLAAVNAQVTRLLGPFDIWQICPHSPTDGCSCRKPHPGMVLGAAQELGVEPAECVMVGDIGADVAAAQAAGATGVLVPTAETLPREIAQSPIVLPDFGAAADWVLGADRHWLPAQTAPELTKAPKGRRVLIVRPDSDGDVLLSGPAIRAVAARAGYVGLWCGPRGRRAAELLPGVDEIIEWRTPWIDPEAPPIDPGAVETLLDKIRATGFDEAIIMTSFHQSALPTALLLRMGGISRISAISEDYPGSLLDLRHRPLPDVPEPERALDLVAAAGYSLPRHDDGRLQVRKGLPDIAGLIGKGGYVVVHPGASVPARSCPPAVCASFVSALTQAGRRVVVTGAPHETALTQYVSASADPLSPDSVIDLGGRTDLLELAGVLAAADCVLVANTGPAHLAAAVAAPVVSLFAPTVPFSQWGPYGVPHRRLGDPEAPCRNSRATLCPIEGHPCLSAIDPADVVAAVKELTEGVDTSTGVAEVA